MRTQRCSVPDVAVRIVTIAMPRRFASIRLPNGRVGSYGCWWRKL